MPTDVERILPRRHDCATLNPRSDRAPEPFNSLEPCFGVGFSPCFRRSPWKKAC